MTTGDEDGPPGGAEAEASDAAERWAAIVRDGLDIWVTQGRLWFDRSRDKTTWSPEDVVGDATNLVEHVTPLAERSLNLSLELLRPWAKAAVTLS